MNRSSAFGTAFGLALLAALVVGGYLLLEYVGGVFTSLEPETRTLAAIGSVVALLSAIIVAEGLKARGVPDRQAEKVLIYERLLAVCCERWHRSGSARAHEAGEFVEIERSLALQGSSGVVSSYLKLRRASGDDAPDALQADLLKRLVAEMRRDLGSRDLITKEGEILELLTRPDVRSEGALHALHE
jgi:hypothetical protein